MVFPAACNRCHHRRAVYGDEPDVLCVRTDIRCRFSEALTVLPFFLPEAIPGLFVGCLVTNLMSTVGPLDIILGSMATLLAALWTAKMPNKWLAPLPPVICNAVIIGAMIAWYEAGFGPGLPITP